MRRFSTLLFRHIRFAENPVIPHFVTIHERKIEVVDANFFKIAASNLQASKSDIILITDCEAAKEKATEGECPTWKRYNCWNHLLNNIKFWLRRHGGKNDNILVYRCNIFSLLICASLEKFEELEQSSGKNGASCRILQKIILGSQLLKNAVVGYWKRQRFIHLTAE